MATDEARRERQAFKDAAEWFIDVTGHTRNHLEEPALGEWCVRDLLGHTSRALSTLSLDPPTGGGDESGLAEGGASGMTAGVGA